MNDRSESGIQYDDVPYVSYEYPPIYRNIVAPGERFVYYRGRTKKSGGRQPHAYLGSGIVGDIRSSENDGRFVYEIIDRNAFDTPLFFKDAEGRYLEPGGATRGYYQRGGRRVTELGMSRFISHDDRAAGDHARSKRMKGPALANNCEHPPVQTRAGQSIPD